MKYIEYAAHERGYIVAVCDQTGILETYEAGNSPHDSQVWIEPNSPNAEPLSVLEKYAKQTALEMADEHGIPHDQVIENADLVDEWPSVDIGRLFY